MIMAQNNITTLKSILLIVIGLLSTTASMAQQKTDSLILNVGKSKIIFLINDQADLKSMQNYDLNQILDHLSARLTGDSTLVREDGTAVDDTTVVVNEQKVSNRDKIVEQDDKATDESEEVSEVEVSRKLRRGTFHSFNFDIGTNNYLQDGAFPDETNEPYSVKPFGSWYVGISSIYKTYVGGPLYLEWGGGVSWYNFKFENKSVRLRDTDNGVEFFEATDTDVEFVKSKLTVAYAHVSFVPMLEFGRHRRYRDKQFWHNWWNNDGDNRGFRIGFGGYAGYKIDSYTKAVIDNGDKEKDRNHDNFHLENFRYGARIQMGYRGTDLFFNYDFNELFSEGGGPKLNAFSFGIIF